MKTDYREAMYSPVEQKTFRSALMNFLLKEFPNMGGPLIMELFIDKIETLIERFYPPAKHLKMGRRSKRRKTFLREINAKDQNCSGYINHC